MKRFAQDRRQCPECGAHLVEIKPNVCTCLNCPSCKLYPKTHKGLTKKEQATVDRIVGMVKKIDLKPFTNNAKRRV